MRHHQISSQTFRIITQYGDMLVVKQSVQQQREHGHGHHHHHATDVSLEQQPPAATTKTNEPQQQQQQQQSTTRPIIMTFHDLGLNSELQFATFCECDEVKLMLQTFTIIHVNFIGQEFQLNGQPASSLPEDFKYPTVEQMAECIVDICAQLRVRSFIAMAVGAGAHIVSSLALLRPDLVHGLFLINPVLSSCSITEWLCFKMSAIASNHQLSGGSHGELSSASDGTSLSKARSEPTSSDRHHSHASSGLRKLWHAVHHHHHHSPMGSSTNSSVTSKHGVGSLGEPSIEGDDAAAEVSSSHHHEPPRPAVSHRLRQLIMSRNFRMGKHNQLQQQQQQQAEEHETVAAESSSKKTTDKEKEEAIAHAQEGCKSQAQHKRRQSNTNSIDAQMDAMERQRELIAGHRRFSGGSSSLTNQQGAPSWPSSPTGRANKRPPIEYLMYHHFGSASFQRMRRPSTGLSESSVRNDGDTNDSASHQQAEESQTPSRDKQHRASCSSSGSGQSQAASTAAAVAAHLMMSRPDEPAQCESGCSHDVVARKSQHDDSPTSRTVSQTQHVQHHQHHRANRSLRSNSVSLTARHLASFASGRQRAAYMQMVYKQYFTQINAHNLWLFAQSFVKRRTLNLRKDCGAAAHAAAAAAALGTSICAAFVGIAPASGCGANEGPARGKGDQMHPAALTGTGGGGGGPGASLSEKKKPNCADKQSQQQQQQQQAVVAGTKVKRTFTCQTLIMCSSVQIHCERALKLMSLLNPLQATWIKTDQMLVLEEKPEKVCQALRLFLQGIGYSMSTYERRLRLNSAQASFSSADSTGSARSLTEPSAASSAVHQQQQKASVTGNKMATT